MLYTPLLPEAGAATLEPRHVVVPVRQMCPHAELLLGRVTALDRERNVVTATTIAGEVEISYETLVVALGAVVRTFPVPGLQEHAMGFKDLADAIALRNRVLNQLERASIHPNDPEELGFVFVGAGYAGVEALGELNDFAHAALRFYSDLAESGSAGCSWTPRRRSSRRSRAASASTPRSTSSDAASRSMSGRRSSRTTGGKRCSPTAPGFLRRRSSGRRASRRIRCSSRWASRSTSAAASLSTRPSASRARTTSGRSATARLSSTRRRRASPTRRPASTRSARRAASRRTSADRRSRTATRCSARWRRSAATRESPSSPSASSCADFSGGSSPGRTTCTSYRSSRGSSGW